MDKQNLSEDVSNACCNKCCTNYTTDDWPAKATIDACLNKHCECHKKCDSDCQNVNPYGFVPEAGCPVHDNQHPMTLKPHQRAFVEKAVIEFDNWHYKRTGPAWKIQREPSEVKDWLTTTLESAFALKENQND